VLLQVVLQVVVQAVVQAVQVVQVVQVLQVPKVETRTGRKTQQRNFDRSVWQTCKLRCRVCCLRGRQPAHTSSKKSRQNAGMLGGART
jgi:hypothetical protein